MFVLSLLINIFNELITLKLMTLVSPAFKHPGDFEISELTYYVITIMLNLLCLFLFIVVYKNHDNKQKNSTVKKIFYWIFSLIPFVVHCYIWYIWI